MDLDVGGGGLAAQEAATMARRSEAAAAMRVEDERKWGNFLGHCLMSYYFFFARSFQCLRGEGKFQRELRFMGIRWRVGSNLFSCELTRTQENLLS
jgi:hypothetical protein